MQNFSQEFLSEYEIVDDLERTEAQSQIGQTWCRKRIAIKKVFDYFGEPTTVEVVEYEAWQVLQPEIAIVPMRKGFVPRVLVAGEWKDATPTQCNNWSSIPKEEKHVNYFLGMISDDFDEDDRKRRRRMRGEMTEEDMQNNEKATQAAQYNPNTTKYILQEPEPQPKIASGPYSVITKIHGAVMSREYFTDKDLAYAEAERLRTKFLYDNSAAAETRAKDYNADPEDFVEIEVLEP